MHIRRVTGADIGVLERLKAESAEDFVNVAEMYDRDALVNERRLIPRVAEAPEELFE